MLGSAHHARIDEDRARLTAMAGQQCMVRYFADISPAGIEQIAPAALVIGGNATDWADFEDSTLEGLLAAVRAASVPILGICAGHQLIGRAHGAAWGPLDPLGRGEPDPDPDFGPGRRKERGFLPVEIDPQCPIFRGFDSSARVFQHHYWQLNEVPEGFVSRAHSPCSAIQAIERLDRPVFGVQFHPERYDDDHPDGEAVLRNFFTLSRAFAPLDRSFERM